MDRRLFETGGTGRRPRTTIPSKPLERTDKRGPPAHLSRPSWQAAADYHATGQMLRQMAVSNQLVWP